MIVLVDDCENNLFTCQAILENMGHEVRVFSNGSLTYIFLLTTKPELLITDWQMPEMDGITLIVKAKRLYPALPVVLMSGRIDDAPHMEGVYYLEKPFYGEDLEALVREQLRKNIMLG